MDSHHYLLSLLNLKFAFTTYTTFHRLSATYLEKQTAQSEAADQEMDINEHGFLFLFPTGRGVVRPPLPNKTAAITAPSIDPKALYDAGSLQTESLCVRGGVATTHATHRISISVIGTGGASAELI